MQDFKFEPVVKVSRIPTEFEQWVSRVEAGDKFRAEPIEYGARDEFLGTFANEMRIMLGSAKVLTDDAGNVTGYQIKTGALHRILGDMQTVGYPISIPAASQTGEPTDG